MGKVWLHVVVMISVQNWVRYATLARGRCA